jgi:hypothetical protein
VTLDPIGSGSPAEALQVPGCPVCQALPRIEAELVGWFASQSFDDPDGRGRVLAAGGLCPRHWWLVLTEERRRHRNSMLGSAELLADTLTHRRSAADPVAPPATGIPAAVPGAGPGPACPLCEDLAASAANRLYLLLADLGQARLEGAPPSWQPCLPHLRVLHGLRLERWLQRWIQAREQAITAAAVEAARRYVRARQPRYQNEATGTEADDLVAALAALIGTPLPPPRAATDTAGCG